MDLLTKAVEVVKQEQRANPNTKQEYQKEVLAHIQKCRGKPIFDVYKVE